MQTGKKASFRSLVTCLADRVGRHQVPVVDGAHEIRGFLGCDGVHHDLISATIRRLYKANRCGHLDAALERGPTLSLLATVRAELLQRSSTDIDQYRLLESLCSTALDYFNEVEPETAAAPAAQGSLETRGKVIALPGMAAFIPSPG